MAGRVLEICCSSLDCALAAERGGADRIELCENLDIGGVTPSNDLIRAVKAAVSIPVFVLVRSRGGDFCFDAEQCEGLLRSIEIAREAGADGIVCGALTSTGEIDRKATRRFIAVARPLPFTFHRAFDACCDRHAGLAILRELGAERVLTSAGQARVADNPGLVRELALAAADRPRILCCGGLRSVNAAALAAAPELTEFHSAAWIEGGSDVSEEEVRQLKAMLAVPESFA